MLVAGFFSKLDSGSHVSVHRRIEVDVLDRPREGVGFPEAEELVAGPVWELSRKDPYLFLQVLSPTGDGNGMEAIICAAKSKVKVFVDTPWAGQRGFFSAWNLLFQIVFRASLAPQTEQFVRGLGVLVNNRGYLINAEANGNSSRLLLPIAQHFPNLGENRLLLRREENDLFLYTTPWTRNRPGSGCANTRLESAILFTYDNKVTDLSLKKLAANFGPGAADSSFSEPSQVYTTPLELLNAVSLPIVAPQLMASELERIVEINATTHPQHLNRHS